MVSRLTEQKGLHLVLACLPEIVRRGGQLALRDADGEVLLGRQCGDAPLRAEKVSVSGLALPYHVLI